VNSRTDVGVVIAAAGQGSRVGGAEPKQFRTIAGTPMLLRSLSPFANHPKVCQVVVALPSSSVEKPPAWLLEGMGDRVSIVEGGPTRGHSVKAAFDALDSVCSVVLVHDAARPFVSTETIDCVIAVAERCGAVPAVAVSDTIKRQDDETRRVVETVDRRGLWRAQTPQGCPREMMLQAYKLVGPERVPGFTDESALLEAAGYPVEIVPDSPHNFKVTTETDFLIAEAMLAR